MNTKGKIDFTKTKNMEFIEQVAKEISEEDKYYNGNITTTLNCAY